MAEEVVNTMAEHIMILMLMGIDADEVPLGTKMDFVVAVAVTLVKVTNLEEVHRLDWRVYIGGHDVQYNDRFTLYNRRAETSASGQNAAIVEIVELG